MNSANKEAMKALINEYADSMSAFGASDARLDRLLKSIDSLYGVTPGLPMAEMLLSTHAELLKSNPYAYFELAYTRYTGWMAWVCTNSPDVDKQRRVLACGQDPTAEGACRAALRSFKIADSERNYAPPVSMEDGVRSMDEAYGLMQGLPETEKVDGLGAFRDVFADMIKKLEVKEDIFNIKDCKREGTKQNALLVLARLEQVFARLREGSTRIMIDEAITCQKAVVDAIRSNAGAGWTRLTGPGQVKVGDKLRFKIGDETRIETVKRVLYAGTRDEELIYNQRRNYYIITSMAIDNSSSQKDVEFIERGKL